jgi:hypothetical protein
VRGYTKVISIICLVLGIGGLAGRPLLLHVFAANAVQSLLLIIIGGLGVLALRLKETLYIAYFARLAAIFFTIVALWGLPSLTHTFNAVLFGLVHLNGATETFYIILAVWGLYAAFEPLLEAEQRR